MIIKRSCEISKITLITEDFSRGTDFVSYDKQVEELGGLFVILTYMILTYIPKNYSEFKQALGRTARHGKKGEFTVFLPDSELSKMGITAMPTVMETLKTVWAKH